MRLVRILIVRIIRRQAYGGHLSTDFETLALEGVIIEYGRVGGESYDGP